MAVDEVDDSLLVAARLEDILCSALTDALRLLHSGEGSCVCLADAVLKSKAALVLLVHLVADIRQLWVLLRWNDVQVGAFRGCTCLKCTNRAVRKCTNRVGWCT